MRARIAALLAIATLACSGGSGPSGFGSRTFDQDVSAIRDVGDGFAVLLADRTVAIAPNDPSAPLQRLGRVDGETPVGITMAGPLILATSSTGEQQQVQAFSRTDHSVRGLASARAVYTCSRGDAPVVFVVREDYTLYGRQYDPTTLAVTHEGLFQGGSYRGCEGDAWGLVFSEEIVVFDADGSSWLGTRDTHEAGERELQTPGELRGWGLHQGTIYALLHGRTEEGSEARLFRIDRQGGAGTPIGLGMAGAEYLVLGDHYACVSDDALHPPHHIWRVALDGTATDVVYEGDEPLGCVGMRERRVIVLRGGVLEALPE